MKTTPEPRRPKPHRNPTLSPWGFSGKTLMILFLALTLSACSVFDRASDPDSDDTTDVTEAAPQSRHAARNAFVDRALEGLTIQEGRLVATAPEAGGPAEARRQLDEFERLMAAGEGENALRALTRAARQSSSLGEPFAVLARRLLALKRYDEAAAALQTAIDRDPEDLDSRLLFAAQLQSRQRYDEAIDQLRHVVSGDPDHGLAHERLAVLLTYLGDRDNALHHLEEAERLDAVVPRALRTLVTTGSPPRAKVISNPAKAEGATIGFQRRVDNSSTRHTNETTIAADGSRVVAAWHQYDSASGPIRIAATVSNNGGQNFLFQQMIRPPSAYRGDIEGDPMTAIDPRTGDRWVGGISFAPQTTDDDNHIFVARRTPTDTSFRTPVMATISASVDKAWLAAGPAPGNPNTTRLYLTYLQFDPMNNTIGDSRLQVSTDAGATWSGQTVYAEGLGHVPRVASDGTLYVGYWDRQLTGSDMEVAISTNGGTSLTSRIVDRRLDVWFNDTVGHFPGSFKVVNYAAFAVSPNDPDLLYMVWPDTSGIVGGDPDVDLFFSRSTDGGNTWSNTTVIDGENPGSPGDQFFPWLEVDDAGRLHMAYFDTRNIPQDDHPDTGQVQAWVEAYYAYSDDRGDTWYEYRLTEQPFDTTQGALRGSNSFLGDYLGLAVAGDTALPLYPSNQAGNGDVFTHSITLPGATIGQVGQVTIRHLEQDVAFGRNFTDPVVIAQPAGFRGGQAAVVRITDVRNDGFTLRLQEPWNLDGAHTNEVIHWIALERGSWRLPDGTRFEVGKLNTSSTIGTLVTGGGFATVSLANPLPTSDPIILSQVQTFNDQNFVKTRQRNESASGFQVALEEEESRTDAHGTETIGWMAFEPGTGRWNGNAYEFWETGLTVGPQFAAWNFLTNFGTPPRFTAGMASYQGSNNAAIRYNNLTATGVELKVEEDTTLDSEVNHFDEEVSYVALGSDGMLVGFPIDAVDVPPTAAFTYSCNGFSCTFDGRSSSDDQAVTLYNWNLGGVSASGPTPSRTFPFGGTFTITLTVTDTNSQTNRTVRKIDVTLAAPTNVQATDNTLPDRVRVTWNPVSGATRYKVYRHTSNSPSQAQQLTYYVNGNSLDDTTANPGLNYFYFVSATDEQVDSPLSLGNAGRRRNDGQQQTLAFVTEDAWVDQQRPTTNFGADPTLFTRSASSGAGRHAYLKFNVPPLQGTVQSVILEIYPIQAQPQGRWYRIFDTSWIERGAQGITWISAPVNVGLQRQFAEIPLAGTSPVQLDVTGMVTGSGLFTLGGVAPDLPGFGISSREGGFQTSPRLVITTQP